MRHDSQNAAFSSNAPEGLEAQRLRALRQYRLLDTAAEPQFDDIAQLAAEVCDAPTAMVTLIDENRQWFKARINLPIRETPRNIAFCNYAIQQPKEPLVIPDASADARFRNNPLVTGFPGIRFYAGMAVATPNGQPIGSVAVLDYVARGGLTTGQSEALCSLARQVTEQLRLIDTISALRLFRVCADQAHDAILIGEFDPALTNYRIVYVNHAFEKITGYSHEALAGQSPSILFGRNDKAFADVVERIRKGGASNFEVTNYRKNGEKFLAEVSVAPVFESNGIPTHWVSVRRDVTEQRNLVRELERARAIEEVNARLEAEIRERERAEASLSFVSMHDMLTGLPNRSLFLDRTGLALRHARTRGETGPYVLYLDLDRFKVINDSLGHEKGDALLVEISRRLASCVSPADTLSRFSDEFVVLASMDSDSEIEGFARHLLECVARPLDAAGEEVHITASLGIAHVDPATHETPEEVVRDAELAMYRAKQIRRGGLERFTPALRHDVVSQLRIQTDIRHALERDRIAVFYQPIVDLRKGRTIGAEALVRIADPERGLIAPDRFIHVAEESGLIVTLGAQIRERVAGFARDMGLHKRGIRTIHVNVSAVEIALPDFAEGVLGTMRQFGVPPDVLCVELTESSLMSNLHFAMGALSTLAAQGVRISIDDFGTGYSSLNYLRRFPISSIKIDRSFVSGAPDQDGICDPAIVKMVAALGGTLGIETVAEGVENSAQLQGVGRLGCTHAQGYAICKPLSESAFREFVDDCH